MKKGRGAYWHCKCSCGNECDVLGAHLRSGHTRSCGCLQKKITRNIGQPLNLQQQRFGKLVAIEQTSSKNKHTYWKCLCDCGNYCEVRTGNLTSGHTISCGCIQSKGEEKIALWLSKHNIKFERQKSFSDCINLDTGALLRFDFFIGDKQVAIEYDGVGHYKSTGGWNSQENVEKTQKRDKIKDEWCKTHNITLLRISYNDCYTQSKLDDILNKI